MRFKAWIENWDEKRYELNGEYWITDDGSVMYADGDVGDYNHEGYVIMQLQGQIADEFGVDAEPEFSDWDETKAKIVQEILDDSTPEERAPLEELYDDEGADPIILQKMMESDPQNAEEKLYLANGFGDAREYAIMKWGWKRVAGNNIESASLTPHDMQVIARGIGEIDEYLADDAEFSISVYGDQNYDVTLAELEAGRLNSAEPEPEQGMQMAPQADPAVSQGWEQKRRQQEKWNDNLTNAAAKQVRDMEFQKLHPYYQQRTFPFGDWNDLLHNSGEYGHPSGHPVPCLFKEDNPWVVVKVRR